MPPKRTVLLKRGKIATLQSGKEMELDFFNFAQIANKQFNPNSDEGPDHLIIPELKL